MCVAVSASVNKQVVDLSDELARKVEDSLRQQEEISSLLAQIVDLQARCKGVSDLLHLHTTGKKNEATTFTFSPVMCLCSSQMRTRS